MQNQKQRSGLVVGAMAAAVIVAVALLTTVGSGGDSKPKPSTGASAATTGTSFDKWLNWQDAPGPKATPVLHGDTYTLDVGNGSSITWKKGEPLKLIFFVQGTSNPYLQALVTGVEDAAKGVGATVTTVNSNFNPATQRAQVQNALASHKYNAAVVTPTSSTDLCKLITEEAPKAGVKVVQMVQGLCGKDKLPSSELWNPGTVAYVGGGGGTADFYRTWAMEIGKSMDKPTKAVALIGPSVIAAVQVTEDVLKEAAQKYPNLQLEAIENTDFTDAKGYSVTQNLLRAHPDLGAVILEYDGQSAAVIRAIKAAGMAGKVKVFEAGSNGLTKGQLEAGTLTMAAAQFPYTVGYCSVKLLAAVQSGKAVPRVVYNDCTSKAKSASATTPIFLTKATIGSFEPDPVG